MANCKGCKWLDAVATNSGYGYCAMVVRSHTFRKEVWEKGKAYIPSSRVRLPDMERCELYAPGEFARRWRDADR